MRPVGPALSQQQYDLHATSKPDQIRFLIVEKQPPGLAATLGKLADVYAYLGLLLPQSIYRLYDRLNRQVHQISSRYSTHQRPDIRVILSCSSSQMHAKHSN
eukprot:1292113-Pleurochrysis_carterae.AAC.1